MSTNQPNVTVQKHLFDQQALKHYAVLGVAFGSFILIDKVMPGTGLMLAATVGILMVFRTNVIDWVGRFTQWSTGEIRHG